MKMSSITADQWLKVLKALAYSFVSAFLFTLSQTGKFDKASLWAAGVAGLNGAFVTVKQLFTEPK